MGEILFLAHRLPFPPDRGDKIRSHHILKRLAELAPVHVATFADQPSDLSHEGKLAEIASTYRLVMRGKPLWFAGMEALAKGKPISLTAFHDGRLAAYIRKTLAERPIEAIYVFSGQMGQYVPEEFRERLVMDLVDVDSAKFEAYGRLGKGPRAWIDRREGRLLAREEQRLARRADETLLVSEAEVALFRARLPASADVNVSVLGNGIDADFFDPDRKIAPNPLIELAGPHLVFTGQMDYAPNVAAAKRIADRILPSLQADFPDAKCHIVGRNPPESLRARHGTGGCHVWGEVPDMRPFLAAADLVVVPLEVARGVQNKVLEAMAMARPVLLTSEAATGIGGRDGVEFAVADEDRALVARAADLLCQQALADGMGRSARRFVMENRTWPAMLAGLGSLLGSAEKSPAWKRDAA